MSQLERDHRERGFTSRSGDTRCSAAGLFLAGLMLPLSSRAAETRDRYYAYPAVHDAQGVIAPWYTAQNGQLDFRIRVAAETLKRYPWTTTRQAADCVPHFLFSGHWRIAADGTITPLAINDWDNGDLGQRAAYVLSGLVDYYRYSGDPAAIALLTLQADFLLDHCLTPADHPWPRFLISVPTKGKPYGTVRSAGHDSVGHRGRGRHGTAGGLPGDRQASVGWRRASTGAICWRPSGTANRAHRPWAAMPIRKRLRGRTTRRPAAWSSCSTFSTS